MFRFLFYLSLPYCAWKILFYSVSTYDVSGLAQSNDYTTTSQLLTLNPSDLQKTFIVPIEDDDIVENTEQFGVRVTSTDSQINIPTATLLISITDNDSKSLFLYLFIILPISMKDSYFKLPREIEK